VAVVVSGNTHNATGFVFNVYTVPTMYFALYTQSEYTPTMHFALYTQSEYTPTMHFALYTQSQYTPTMRFASYTHNAIGFVLNRCFGRVQRRVCSVAFLFENNSGTTAAHHIGIRRAIAEVSIRTEVLIRTSDAEG